MAGGLTFHFRKRDCTIYEAKKKAQISCLNTMQLILAFVLFFHMRKAGFLMTQLIFGYTSSSILLDVVSVAKC